MATIDTHYEFVVHAVTHEACGDGGNHVVALKLVDGRMQTAAFAAGMIEQHGASYVFCGQPMMLHTCAECTKPTLREAG